MRVTFDSNTLDKACRPERFHKDKNQPIYQKVHDAIKSGAIQGVYSATLLTIEGVMRADRAKVIASTRLELQREDIGTTKNGDLPEFIRKIVGVADITTVTKEMKVVEPGRQPLHEEFVRRVIAAKAIGMRILKAPPRAGAFQYTDPSGEYYVNDETPGDLADRINKMNEVANAIEARGVGYAQLKALGTRLAAERKSSLPWFKALASTANIHDERAVERAFGEWADGDSIAAHFAYGIDVFCTDDRGGSNAAASILDSANRNWLTETYGLRFIAIQELGASL